MKPYAEGLIVGKFAPLHAGHELLINAALARCETVFIISYSLPEMPGCEPEKRLQWLQTRFPRCRHRCFRQRSRRAMILNRRRPTTQMPIATDTTWLPCANASFTADRTPYSLRRITAMALPAY